MPETFNPYHVWLGIPPEEQPANYYRLLGLRSFETSGDVIDSAADRQMAHLRTFQSGKHGELTQRLLNEVAAARICLLDPKKRAAYDHQLRAKLPPPGSAPPGSAPASGSAGSAIRRTAVAAPASRIPVAQALPQPADQWDDLLGNPAAEPAHRSGGKSASAGAAKNRNISYGIAAVVLVVAAGIGLFALNGSPANGTLVFDWPSVDRADTTVTVDNVAVPAPASGAWEYKCPPGPHHIVAQRPAYKLDVDVAVAAGEQKTIPSDWTPKATLVLNWPLALRAGADLRIDGRAYPITQHEPMEIAVEPGTHVIHITPRNSQPIVTSKLVAADGRELMTVTPPVAPAKLVFDWPSDDRKDAALVIDGSRQVVPADSQSASFALMVPPGQHVIQITRTGFEPFNQPIELAAGADQSIKPTWTPVQKAASVVEAPPPVETQPAKKLPIPSTAEQERVAKQLDDLYKTSRPGPKDPALAQQLFDVAAKDGSSPAERYMLLWKGAEIAAAAGDLNLSLQGVDTLDASYEINPLELKQKLLEKFISAGKADHVAPAIQAAEQLADQAVAADEYELALMLLTTASHAVTKSLIPDRKAVEERLSHRRHDIRILQPIQVLATKAQETLEKNPADPEANLAAGRWLAFYKQNWTAGLPLLAKGSDEKLKSLAEAELKNPTVVEQQIQLADAWWDLAQKEAGAARDSLHLHAGNIYQGAVPNLTSALKKAAIEKRLAEIAELKPIAMAAATSQGNSTAVRFPLHQWVDVLHLIDPNRDSLKGAWASRGGELAGESGEFSRILLPINVDGSYDLEVDFTRTSGNDAIATMFAVGSRSCMVNLSGWAGAAGGLMDVDGREVNDDRNQFAVRPSALENNRRYRLLIRAKILAKDRASVDVSLDGKKYSPHWEGNPQSLSVPSVWALPASKNFGFGEYGSDVTFHSARLRMVSGHASLDVAVADSGTPAPAPSTSARPAGVCRITSKHGNLCLGTVGEGKQSGNAIGVWTDAAGADRLWEIIPIADGKVKIINEKSGKCFAIVNGSTSADAFALEWSFENAPDQRWFVERAEGGAYKFMNDKSGLCLGVRGDGPTVELEQYTGTDTQQWTLAPLARADHSPVSPNGPTIVSARWGRTIYSVRLLK